VEEKADIGDFLLNREERTTPRRHQIDEKPAIGDVFFLGQRIHKDRRVMRYLIVYPMA
jgi:hypothetical protein